jgi:hypothetical protein
MHACALQGEGTKLREIPNGTLPAFPHQCLSLAVMMTRCLFRRPCAADAVLLMSAAVHFKLSKIPGREELMELLHDVLYRRRGQVEDQALDCRLDWLQSFTVAASV